MFPNRMFFTAIIAAVVLLFAVGSADAQSTPPTDAAPTDTFEDVSSVVLVEVPVTVHRRGAAIRDLEKENFEITALGKKQDILDFEIVDLTQVAAGQDDRQVRRAVPLNARRYILLLFDLAFSLPDRLIEARRAAINILDDLHPTDMIAVGTHSSANGANFIVNFTTDRQQVRLALDSLGTSKPLTDRGVDPLGIFLGETQVVEGNGQNAAAGLAEAELQDALDRAFEVEQQIGQKKQEAFFYNITGLAKVMANIQGRKHVVVLTEGFGNDRLFGAATNAGEIGASGSLYGGPGVRAGSTRMQNLLNDLIREFKRTGTVVQSVHLGKKIESDLAPRAGGADALFTMAHDTGGELYENFNDLSVALDQMIEKTGVTYLLTFQVSDIPFDGKFYDLKIKLKDSDRVEIAGRTRIRHREGFYAPLPYDQMNPNQRRLDTATVILGDNEGGALGMAAYAVPLPGGEGKPYVPVLIEVDGPSVLAATSTNQAQLELYAYAMDADGKVHDFIHQNLGLDFSKIGNQMSTRGLKYFGHFDLPAGSYVARVMVRHGKGAYAVRTVPIAVPAFERGRGPLLLPPSFPEIGASQWLLARETERRRRNDVPYPFLLGEQPYLPAAMPFVPREGETQVLVPGVRLEDEVELTGTVRDAAGRSVGGANLSLDQVLADVGGVRTVSAKLRTSGLAPGEYTLSAQIRSAGGSAESPEVRFRVP